MLCRLLRKRYEEFSVPVLATHNKKLLELWKSERSRSPDALMNLSEVKLSLMEENALRLGLKHHILPKKIDKNSLRVDAEKLISDITYKVNVALNLDFKEKLKSLLNSYVSAANGLCSNKQNQALHRTLRALSFNKKIKICKYDKGNGVVVLNCVDYFNKLDTIVLDKDKFEEIFVSNNETHPVISNENRLKSFLYRNVKGCIDEDIYNNITPSGSQPGKLYGLCKVHKTGNPMRPVISMINTAEFNLAKYLDTFIKPNINHWFSVSSTNEFMDKVDDFKFSEGDELVSFDVCSLYTNVPLDETINLISDCVYSEESLKVPPFPKKIFQKLLKHATSGMFLYNDKLYRQVDGVAMGSPLGPSLANFFLGHLEKYKFFNNTDINPKLYVRYVDDIFAVFDKNVSFQLFLDHINQQHPNIKFTVEKSINNVLPFLNTKITLVGDHFESCIYRKDTNTNVLLNACAVCPQSWKKGILFGALNRAKIVCNSRGSFMREANKLKIIFWKNGYSEEFFNKVYRAFELKSTSQVVKTDLDDSDNLRFIFKIPFVGTISHDFKNKLSRLFYEDLSIKITPVFNTFKVGDYFSLKSRTPKLLTSNVVYKFSGLCDTNLSYIGKTKRHLMVRCLEHLEFEKSKPESEIKSHLQSCDVCKNASPQNFEILKKCRNDRETKINEALFIKNENPKLNKNLFNKGSFYTLKLYQ